MPTEETFWAVTCESGKRYSQVLPEKFCITMAALEPRDTIPENKQVSLVVEHRNREFLLCTLDYYNAMQVPLKLKFSKEEHLYFFITGEGTVHLSGYHIIEKERITVKNAQNGMFNDSRILELTATTVGENEHREQSRILQEEDYYDDEEEEDSDEGLEDSDECLEDSEEEEEEDNEEEDEDLGTNRLLTLDDSDEDDSEDWSLEKEKQFNPRLLHKKEEDVLSSLEGKKRKKSLANTPEAKRPKISSNSVKANEDAGVEYCGVFKPKDTGVGPLTVCLPRNTGLNSSRRYAHYPNETPDSKSVMSSTPMSGKRDKEKSEHKQPFTRVPSTVVKLPSGVEYEDVRIGKGAIAKLGKTVHIYYIGKLSDGHVFDSIKEGKPFSICLGDTQVIAGWDEGIEGMRVGGKRRLKIPPSMGFGEKGCPCVPKNSTLYFLVQLKAVT